MARPKHFRSGRNASRQEGSISASGDEHTATDRQSVAAELDGGRRIARITLFLALGVVLWLVGHVLLLVFAGILLAVGLDGLARNFPGRAALGRLGALAVVVFLLAGAIVSLGWVLIPELIGQLTELWKRLGDFYVQMRDVLGQYGLFDGDEKAGLAEQAAALVNRLASATLNFLGLLAGCLVVVAIALLAAANPGLYRRGALALVPRPRRERLDDLLGQIAHALRWWFLGQLVSMLVLGILVSAGLWLIGVDLWLGLGVLTALFTFVPFLDPMIAGVPIVIIGFAMGSETGVLVLAFYVAVQVLEGNFLTPYVQHRAVDLPPVVLISSQVLLGVLFGPLGFILAAPLTAVALVAVRVLYVEDVLGA